MLRIIELQKERLAEIEILLKMESISPERKGELLQEKFEIEKSLSVIL